MIRVLLGLWAVLGLAPLEAAEPLPRSSFSVIESPQGVTILEGIRPVLSYQRATTSQGGQWPRANYVHPLYDLDGEVLSEDFPRDHPHQRGIFWAWHQVLVDGQAMGDSWTCEDFQWDVLELHSHHGENQVALSTRVHWQSPALTGDNQQPLPFVQEKATITVHAARENTRRIDFDIELLALVDHVAIAGSRDEKGYGGFSPRLKMSPETVFQATAGVFEPTLLQLAVGPWVDLSNTRGGVAMLTHCRNPDYPTPWILRSRGSMQNAVYPGVEPRALSTTEPLQLRYALLLHRGQLEPAQIDEFQQQYCAAEPTPAAQATP